MKKLLFLLSLCVWLSSCDSEAFKCLDSDEPRFATPSIDVAFVGEEYDNEIVAFIKREPNDDDFHYRFYIEGDLPEGIYIEQEYHSRYLQLKGTPTIAGEYTFTLHVEVSDPPTTWNEVFDDDYVDAAAGLCHTSAEKSYSLIVERTSETL